MTTQYIGRLVVAWNGFYSIVRTEIGNWELIDNAFLSEGPRCGVIAESPSSCCNGFFNWEWNFDLEWDGMVVDGYDFHSRAIPIEIVSC
jgi:hypothetical protein